MSDDLLKGLKLFEQNPGLAARIHIMYFEWVRVYQHVDVKAQIGWAHSWLMCNPKKVKKDIIKFLNNWLKSEERRACERRDGDRRRTVRYVEHRPPEQEVMTSEDWKKLRESIRK